ncbi:hypothetical protein [Methylobacterium sp. A54F]
MMRVAVTEVGLGLHPEEVVVCVATRDGDAKLAVDREALLGKTLRIGYPVEREGDFYLIELPRETFQGAWRVWVPEESLSPDETRSRVYA